MTKVRLDVMSGVSALLGPGSWELVLVMMILENIHSIIYRAERGVGRTGDAVECSHLNCHKVFFTRSYYILTTVCTSGKGSSIKMETLARPESVLK